MRVTGTHRDSDLRRGEPPVFEETLLARARFRIGSGASELSCQHLAGERVPVDLGGGERRAGGVVGDAALAQFLVDANRALAARDARAHEDLDEARVVLQALRREGVERLADDGGVMATRRQFALEFAARVLASRERGQRLAARRDCRIVGQASASSSSSAFVAAVCGNALARICASSSAASSGCSFR